MNSILLFERDQQKSGVYRVGGKRAAHILQHLKIESGTELNVTLIGLGLAQARAYILNDSQVDLELCSEVKKIDPLPLSVLIGLSRPPTLKKILEHGSTFGVSNFHFFNAELGEKSYSQSKILDPTQTEKLLDLGLSQSRAYAHRAHVQTHSRLPELTCSQTFYLDQESEMTLADAQIDFQQEVLFALGPERGWSENERQKLKSLGYRALSLAPTTLRVEHALFALLGQYHLLKARPCL